MALTKALLTIKETDFNRMSAKLKMTQVALSIELRWRQEIRYNDNPPYAQHQTFCIRISQHHPEMFLWCEG